MKSSNTFRKSVFRPCIDLHDGQVKQIVGGTLSDHDTSGLKTNFIARLVHLNIFSFDHHFIDLAPDSQSSGDFARIYKDNGLEGGHVIKLGPRNDPAAKEALAAWPGPFWCSPTMSGANQLYVYVIP